MMGKKSEMRKNKRTECFVPVDGKEGTVFDQVKTVDISKGGLGFISRHPIPVNKQIPIEIAFSEEGDPVFVLGKVTWVDSLAGTQNYRIGLTFENVFRGSKSRLNNYFR